MLSVFKEALVRIYLARLSGYTDQEFKVTGADATSDRARTSPAPEPRVLKMFRPRIASRNFIA